MEETRFKIEFLDRDTIKQFEKLPNTVQTSLGKAMLTRLEVDPIGHGKPLRYSLKGHRRLRVGDYLIVYRIDHPKRCVIIVAVDHRKDVYNEF
ncbi:MAG: type II toxin-antitoxin system RelE/ParE family toxin [Chlamydiales bacterium]